MPTDRTVGMSGLCQLMDYTTVTETPGIRVTREAFSMLYTRYTYAMTFCDNKDVLEVACGTGQGLGYLSQKARRVIGGDYTESLIQEAQQYYRGRVPLLRLDAHVLPFRTSSFDVVILYEAIYYLAQPDKFLDECHRVLRDKGVVLICTVNKEWSDFNPSPLSTQYVSAKELSALLSKHRFQAELYGAFPVTGESNRERLISLIKRTAVTLHLIPKTMKGKELLKRIFLDTLVPLPPEIRDGMAEYRPPQLISYHDSVPRYKVLYAIGRVS